MPAFMVAVRPGRECGTPTPQCYVASPKALKTAPSDVLAWGWHKVVADNADAARLAALGILAGRVIGPVGRS